MAKRNIHNVDRLSRVLMAEGLIFLAYFKADPRFEMLLYGLAVLLIINALIGISTFYILFDINTRERYKRSLWLEGVLIYSIVFVAMIPLYLRGEFNHLDRQLLLATGVGFMSQMVDGSLGMGFGTISNTVLLSLGVPPIVSSASIHTAEIVTAGTEGVAHLRAGNVDRRILKYLIVPGMLGALIGAYLLMSLPGEYILPFISLYLLIMGFLLIEKAFQKKPLIIKALIYFRDKIIHAQEERRGRKLVPFGVGGGILDSIGGGGWGPLITLTLFFRGENLRQAIGSVVLSEFFVAITASVALLSVLRLDYWQTIAGLIIGGLLAVPLGPYITKKLPYKPLMITVGVLVVLLSSRNLLIFFISRI